MGSMLVIIGSFIAILPSIYTLAAKKNTNLELPPTPTLPPIPDFSAVLSRIRDIRDSETTSATKYASYESESENEETESEEPMVESSTAGTGCIPCTRDHLSTVSAALNEAIRFARSEGVNSPEVKRRLRLSSEELNVLERIDASPDAIEALPLIQKALMVRTLPDIRGLRHQMPAVKSVEDLQRVAAEASELSQRFWDTSTMLESMEERTQDMLEVARQVKEGTITEEEGKERLREIITSCKVCGTVEGQAEETETLLETEAVTEAVDESMVEKETDEE